ncbi:MAG: hypothetical protein KOO63_12325 [Bacteroidales bacterium]|nr:hypothetical protein [Candidatus Latescibacterota bacterium]
MLKKALLITVLMIFASGSSVLAEIPKTINYQGVLTDAEGNAVVDGIYEITTSLYDNLEGGTPLWQETQSVNVFKSTFSAILGVGTALELPFDNQYYLGISIEGGAELMPRVSLSALPYSMCSNNADMLDGLHSDAFSDTAHNHDEIYFGQEELSTAGTVNDTGNPVDWTKLKNVPSGFSDGIDNAGLTAVYSLDAVDGDPTDAVYVDESGNTGVGTSTPAGKLDINGDIVVTNSLGQIRSRIFVHSEDAGLINTYGPNGNLNCAISAMVDYENSGYLSVCDADGNKQAAMYVEGSSGMGVITADIKSFRVSNPSLPGTDICYACIEGPEAAAYIRGTMSLVNGKATVVFPDHFVDVIVLDGMTIQLTPLSAGSKGLAVVEKGIDRVLVQELNGGVGEYEFDYLVTAIRKGHESYQVIKQSLIR